jgi:hypothetical protein
MKTTSSAPGKHKEVYWLSRADQVETRILPPAMSLPPQKAKNTKAILGASNWAFIYN